MMQTMACGCCDPECMKNGCKNNRGRFEAKPPMGCICPPGAEARCKGFMCPRRGATDFRAVSIVTTAPHPAGSGKEMG